VELPIPPLLDHGGNVVIAKVNGENRDDLGKDIPTPIFPPQKNAPPVHLVDTSPIRIVCGGSALIVA